MSTTLKLDGLRAFRAGLDAALDAAADRTADQLVALEQNLCPVGPDQGDSHTHLRDTIRKVGDAGSGRRLVVAGDESRGVLHAPYVNYGTRHMAARPFVEPAQERIDHAKNVADELAKLAARSGI
jgi:HK97 gp10 family phage protein